MVALSELRNQSKEDLKTLFSDLSKEIYKLRNEVKMTRKIEKTHLIKEKKKTRARIMTVLREQEINALEGTHGKS
jgi:large subunit ribosomal protein L29